ncbi:unnamed protein product (macronuclear) [Paramecium tetraurelia]|uniref:Brix domain-containing protein n=1 Tax=Paramecium tetraurelia TaxID=5888 RepID=A0BS07_PARTE|nr:uncharacterized protein GSPATT00031555001 [Paramecium tetraurelia]CAK61324.1 unnamed protein product [Paramecium tetraurelia]|eukprot:XP_001428722.1 hypothetical protein (macronuclear) [Paramecium tetraurelia strain d4-2]
MLRKNVRLRKEYLMRIEDEKRAKQKYDNKMRLLNAEIERKNVPTDLYRDEENLRKEMNAQDDNTIVPRTHLDDEYAMSFYREPQIVLTTSRSPSQRLVTLMKEMGLIFPNCTRVNRGAQVVKDLVIHCQQKNYSDLIIVHEHRGEPDGLIISHMPLGPTIYFGVKNAVLRHDLDVKADPLSEQYPHLIFDNFSTKLGERVTTILKHLFPVPKIDSKRVLTFHNENGVIQFRHHTYQKSFNQVDLNEQGPRFELKPYKITLGTIGQKEAIVEWQLRTFINTAGKKSVL